MKITKRFLYSLIREAQGDNSCPKATQDKALNDKNKKRASLNKKVKYGLPSEVPELKSLAKKNLFCSNCAAYDISKNMIRCGGANKQGTIGYCKMHDFSCASKKTCLTHAKGGPIR